MALKKYLFNIVLETISLITLFLCTLLSIREANAFVILFSNLQYLYIWICFGVILILVGLDIYLYFRNNPYLYRLGIGLTLFLILTIISFLIPLFRPLSISSNALMITGVIITLLLLTISLILKATIINRFNDDLSVDELIKHYRLFTKCDYGLFYLTSVISLIICFIRWDFYDSFIVIIYRYSLTVLSVLSLIFYLIDKINLTKLDMEDVNIGALLSSNFIFQFISYYSFCHLMMLLTGDNKDYFILSTYSNGYLISLIIASFFLIVIPIFKSLFKKIPLSFISLAIILFVIISSLITVFKTSESPIGDIILFYFYIGSTIFISLPYFTYLTIEDMMKFHH